ncbi:MAG: IscS subfamily cysteine desulfurase [Gemmataceae bacterium]|nr:IscS subfamily cysteine desulfurase [Gemmataceae bacterium]
MPRPLIYLDNHATTRTDPRVVEAMLPYFTEEYGNASSLHALGQRANSATDAAREQVATLIGAEPREIVFTSGATESDNLAIKGVAAMHRGPGKRIVTCRTEHRAVLDVCRKLQRDGFDVVFLPVDGDGLVSAEQVVEAIDERTILVSIMLANNEIGALQPVAAIGAVCKERGVLFHTDATQAVGKIPVDVHALQVDLLSLSAHKMHGPKGVGALWVRRRDPHVRLEPLFDGGGHERGMRPGTLPVPIVVGLGLACEIAGGQMKDEGERMARLRDRLHEGLAESLDEVRLNGHPTERLPNNLNVSFAGVRGEALLMALRNLAVSSGSACTSASVEPSYVLRAIGLSDDLAHASLRFGLSRFTTEAEIETAIEETANAVRRLRALSPERLGSPLAPREVSGRTP